jgi:hypothetical protein
MLVGLLSQLSLWRICVGRTEGGEEDAFGLGRFFALTDVHLQSKSGKMMKY